MKGIDKLLTRGGLPPAFPSHAPDFSPIGPESHLEHQTPSKCHNCEQHNKTHWFRVLIAPLALPRGLTADRKS